MSDEVNEFLAAAAATEPAEGFVEEVEVEVPAGEASEEVGQAETEGEANEADQYLNLDEYGNRLVKLKVAGEEIEVPLSEATAGYQRQADYTRKSQELAQARAIQQALDNPATRQQALRLLQETYGQAQPDDASSAASQEPLDPATQEIQYLRSQVSELAQWRAGQALDAEMDRLQGKYGDVFDAQELIDAAAMRGVSDVSELEDTFKMIAFDKVTAQQSAGQTFAATKAAEEAARVAAKEKLGQVVTSGNGVVGNSVGSAPTSYATFEEAFEAAAAAAGFD